MEGLCCGSAGIAGADPNPDMGIEHCGTQRVKQWEEVKVKGRQGMRKAPGIPSSQVARVKLFAWARTRR